MPVIFTACTLQELPVIGGLFGPGAPDPVELTMWGLWENETTIGPVFSEYQTTSPHVSFKYEDMSVLKLDHLVEYKKRVFSRMEQSTWDADVVLVHNSWLPRLIGAGFLSPMPLELLTPQRYSDVFYPAAAESGVDTGQIYGVPAYYDGLALVYNKDHFEEIGQLTPPTAWEEFRRIAIDLTILSEEENEPEVIRAGAAVGAADNVAHFSDILGLMWSQAGVRIPDDMDSIPAQDALSFYVSLMKDHNVWRNDFPEATTAFVNEQVSMIFVPSWQLIDILESAPGLNIGVAPVPQALADNPVSWGSFWMYVVPNNSDSPASAWNFINFASSETGEKSLYSSASKERPFGAAHALTTLAQELSNHEYLGAYVQTAPYAQSAEIAGRSGNRVQEDELLKAVNSMLLEKKPLTAAEALSAAKEAIDF